MKVLCWIFFNLILPILGAAVLTASIIVGSDGIFLIRQNGFSFEYFMRLAPLGLIIIILIPNAIRASIELLKDHF